MARTIVVAHHTPDLYGSDLQLLESVGALVEAGHRVVATLPTDGPLVVHLRARGAEVVLLPVPVLRKELLTPAGVLRLALECLRRLPGTVRLLTRHRPDALYVNTLIVPLWLVAGRLARVRTLTHVHEAQTEGPRALRAALVAPLLLSHGVVVNSQASLAALHAALPAAARRARVVYNGIPTPEALPTRRSRSATDGRPCLVVVGRLSPRKGIDVALEAAARLRRDGVDVELVIAGSAFRGYEWYETELRERAARPDLAGAVRWLGYVRPTWDVLDGADVVLVPSRTEPFGNTAAEAQLAQRPVVASAVGGLPEIVSDEVTGLLVAPDDATALAAAIGRLLDDQALADRLAERGRLSASDNFSLLAYRKHILSAISGIWPI